MAEMGKGVISWREASTEENTGPGKFEGILHIPKMFKVEKWMVPMCTMHSLGIIWYMH